MVGTSDDDAGGCEYFGFPVLPVAYEARGRIRQVRLGHVLYRGGIEVKGLKEALAGDGGARI